MLTNCLVCNKEIELRPSRFKKSKNHYCSKKCMSIEYKRRAKLNKVLSYCGFCNKPLTISPAFNSSQKFCNDVCYRKYREISTAVTKTCVICNKVFTTAFHNKDIIYCCSNKCKYKRLELLGSSIINCSYCGKKFKISNSKDPLKRHYCSKTCFGKGTSFENSSTWKCGSYRKKCGNIYVFIGKYNKPGKNKLCKYKNRRAIEAEMYLGYVLKDGVYSMSISGISDYLQKIYICSGISEYLKIKNGSIARPTVSNLPIIKDLHLYENNKKLPYARFPDEIIKPLLLNSYKTFGI